MACQSFRNFSSLLFSSPPLAQLGPRSSKRQLKSNAYPLISSQISTSCDPQNDDVNFKRTQFDFLHLSVTLTVISTSLTKANALAATATKERKRRAKKPATRKPPEALTTQELKSWCEGIPQITNHIPYTEILELKKEGKLKHLIKVSSGFLRQWVEPMMVVLEDSRVLRTVLPSMESNRRFWEEWDEMGIDSICVNSYTPPVKPPEVPAPYLGWFLAIVPTFMYSYLKSKKETKRAVEEGTQPQRSGRGNEDI